MLSVEELYDKHIRTVYGFFMLKTHDRQKAEDLTSEVFVTTLEQLRNKDGYIKDSEKYLYGVMKLTWLQYLRKKYKEPIEYVENVGDFYSYATGEINAYKDMSLSERAAPFIARLPDSQRTVLELRFIEGLSLAEICKQLGRDMNYVKTTQKRGLASLKRVVMASDDAERSEI